MNRRTRRTASMLRRRNWSDLERITMAHTIGAERAKRAWFKVPELLAARVTIGPSMAAVGSYAWAKQSAQETAAEWMERELNRPASSLNHGTARFAGKPYHWRQDYTGQLKLAAGESPW